MPTQRTTEITLTQAEQMMIRLAVQGSALCNLNEDHAGTYQAYGGFHDALDRVMSKVSYHDPDFMELWDSNRVQGSLDISSHEDFPQQIKYVLGREFVTVILE